MRKTKTILLSAMLLPMLAEAALPTHDETVDLVRKVNRHWQETHPKHGRAFWDNAAYHTGNMEAYYLTGDTAFLNYSKAWSEHNLWAGAKGTDRSRWRYNYGETDDHVLFGDWQICFQTYADLYNIDPDTARIARAREVMEYEMQTDSTDYWWWADGLYMVMPVMTKMHNITGDGRYLEKLHEYWQYANTIMYDDTARLYYRDAKYVYPKHKSVNGKKDFWARGDGWVLAGLAKVIQDLPDAAPYREEYVSRFKDMAAAVKGCQQPEGYWTRSLLDPGHAPGPETSGTAFFTYGLLWGVNHGLLDRDEYLPAIEKAWTYLTEVALQPDGSVGYVQPIGEKAIPGQTVDASSTANFGVGAFLLAACEMARFAQSTPAARFVEVAPGYGDTSVNTAVFRANSVVSDGDWQYVAYYDPEGHMCMAKRRVDSDRWQTHRTRYKGKVTDAHNVISIGIDGEGRLHASFDHHGGPLKYCRAVAPGSLEMSELMPMTGDSEGNVTYPEFYTMPDGSLLFAYRDGASGRGNLVINRYDTAAGEWRRVQDVLIDGEDKRNAYWQMHVDPAGVIHLSWVWRETWLVETNHDLCYARSKDGGVTWEKSTGEVYDLPITAANAEYAWRIPQKSELINQTSMTADAAGNPYIATYWREAGSDVPQYRLVWHDGQRWQASQVGERTQPFSLSGGGTKMIPIARPRMVIDGDNVYYLLRDAERGSKATMAVNRDLGHGPWTYVDLTDCGVDAWEPSYDTNLWARDRRLHVFLQRTRQGDGEKTVAGDSTPVCIMEVDTH